jgi:peptidyl-prolyl cis-trans isomerase C
MKLPLFCSVLLPLALLAQNPPAPDQNPPAPKMTVTPIAPTRITLPPANMPPDTVILVIGDMKITRAQFELLLQKGAAERMPQTERRKMAVALADIVTLAAEARRQALDQTPYAQMNLAIVADQWLANLVVTKEVRDKPVDEAAAKAYYDKNLTQFDQVTARHILIRFHGSPLPLRPDQKDLTDEEALAKARDLKKKLDAGADFAEMAKAESDDTASAKNGGLLGPPFGRGQMVPEFENAAFAATVGKATDPVKTAYGYHLILVTEHKPKTYEQVKADVGQQVKQQAERQYVEAVRLRTKVTIDETYFGRPDAPPPTLAK